MSPQGENLKFQSLNTILSLSPQSLPRWVFSAKVLDILETNQTGGYTATYENQQVLLRRDYVYDYEGQIIELGINYTFNYKKQKAQKPLISDDFF